MALTLNVNSYATVATASAYFADRLRTTAWDAAADADRSKALIMATRLVDQLDFVGARTADDQPLAWPRQGAMRDGAALSSTAVPIPVIEATCETALSLLSSDLYADDATVNVKRTKSVVGPIAEEVEYDGRRGPSTGLPEIARKLLSPLVDGGFGISSAAWVV